MACKESNLEEVDALLQVLAGLDDKKDVASLIEDLFTAREVKDISQRLSVARLLASGWSYSEIAAETGASATTIARVSRCLAEGSGGYAQALALLPEVERRAE